MPHKDPEAARAWRREWWKRSPEIREKQNARTRQMKSKINAMLREHKLSVGCADCGYNTHHAALEFHHIGDDKEINISFAKSIGQAQREMEKYEVLCSNCHRIRHWQERYPCKPDIFAATYDPADTRRQTDADAYFKVLQTIALFPVTDPKNMDAVNMRLIAQGAITLTSG